MSTSHAGTHTRRTASRSKPKSSKRPLALVTGATSGLGLAISRDLAHDHDLILIARTAKDLDELASVLGEESKAQVTVLAADLTDDAATAKAVAALELERLNVLVHCAGVESLGSVAEIDSAEWHEVMNLNVIAPALLTRLLLPQLRAAKGLVVLVNSGAGQHPFAGQVAYCTSKHALRALADCLRMEERGQVRVTSIFPGRIDTPMQRRIHKQMLQVTRTDTGKSARGGRGNGYRPEDHMTPTSVAATVRLAVDLPVDAAVEELTVRPSELT
ncbi:SDR family oxidoreductase [Actinomyces trachealis]|uniref:SDR family oxidoreductase n=1 Tax=Actinomyces trachealis TaxID=2763540 RepID=UPI0018C6C87E|nr:SDR family oxidoreductase [Actinomyces trachealis]